MNQPLILWSPQPTVSRDEASKKLAYWMHCHGRDHLQVMFAQTMHMSAGWVAHCLIIRLRPATRVTRAERWQTMVDVRRSDMAMSPSDSPEQAVLHAFKRMRNCVAMIYYGGNQFRVHADSYIIQVAWQFIVPALWPGQADSVETLMDLAL